MRLNVQTDYALRLLMHLAVNNDQLCTISDIAAHYGISKNHLMKVASNLCKDGFIETMRGRTGGLRLTHAPNAISLGDVVRSMEADFALVECFQGGNECVVTPACRLKNVIGKALEAFLSVFDDYTLDDLVRRNPQLKSLLLAAA